MTDKAQTDKAQNGKMPSGKAGSKFSGLLAAVKEREEDQAEEARAEAQPAPEQPQVHRVKEGPVRGRPRGKRSSEAFVQVTAYIGRQTHRDVKIALLSEGEGREFSELVEELLARWLDTNRP